MKKRILNLTIAVFVLLAFAGIGASGAAEVKATCPVTGEAFKVSKATPSYTHGGKEYKFCCPSCIDEFKKNPEKYAKKSSEEHKHSHE